MHDFLTDRRTMIGAGALLAGAGAIGAPAAAQPGATGWRPAADKIDDWYEAQPGHRHRSVYDTATAAQGVAAMGYANNAYFANSTGYGLKPQEMGTIIVLRHLSTPYAYSDATWAKYGKLFAAVMELKDKEAERAATVNPMLVAAPGGEALPPGFEFMAEANLSALAAKGCRYAVCELATKFIALKVAGATQGDAAAIEKELSAGLIPGAHMVPAGIVAVNRAQEHGYTLAVVE